MRGLSRIGDADMLGDRHMAERNMGLPNIQLHDLRLTQHIEPWSHGCVATLDVVTLIVPNL
jgi:hypothetical protein